jgi:hypothetical protein
MMEFIGKFLFETAQTFSAGLYSGLEGGRKISTIFSGIITSWHF